MSQIIFKDPIVSVAPVRTGVGTGNVSIDRLTHFTVAQIYTLTCIAKSPDTLFSVAGSLDGNVGIAVVGTQFYDQDLKIFLTITQGPTVFEVGDQFVFTVANGTDLNQANIDEYDELPQKNFQPGLRGVERGDANLRYSNTAQKAYRFIQGLKYLAQTAGVGGNSISIEYANRVAAIAASRTIQDLTYTAQTPGAAGNAITLAYQEWTPAQAARVTIQNLEYQAVTPGTGGNAITIAYTTGGVAGSEVVSVISNAISVQIQSGVSTALQIANAVAAFPAAAALVTTAFKPTPAQQTNAQSAPVSPTNLVGGSNAIGAAGFEVVQVTGTDILVTIQGGVSTATQVKAAIDASSPAHALVSVAISGTGSNAQTTFVGTLALTGGANAIGTAGAEVVQVVGNAIKVYLESGKSTATQVKAAVDGFGPAAALVSVSLLTESASIQYAPRAAEFLVDGKAKVYSFNHDEFTDSGSFAEGNASVHAGGLKVDAKTELSGHTHIADVLSLNDPDSTNNSGIASPNVQQLLNHLLQDQKLTLRTADNTHLSWNKPLLSFEADIQIDFPDTDKVNTIALANSPISIADGQSLYVILDRLNNSVLTPLVANTVPVYPGVFRVASRFGDILSLWDNTLIRDGRSVSPGEGGSGGDVHAQLYDSVDTVLPSGATATIDGVAVTNNMLVLFTNLTSGNNKIYKAAGVGTAITWTAQGAFFAGLTPTIGETVVIEYGTSFGLQKGVFDGATFKFNATVRHFVGLNYWEQSGLQTSALADNTTADIFSVTLAGSENMVIDFSLVRGTAKEVGSIHVTSDGTNVSLDWVGTYIAASGVTFSATVVTGVLHIKYTTSSTGVAGTIKYSVKRWSDSAGGPAGIPSYSGGPVAPTAAAGTSGDIQYNSAGSLAGDTSFKWDSTNKILTLNGMEFTGLKSATLLDNQTGATWLTYVAATYRFVTIEFSVLRDGKYMMGRMLIANDGTITSFSADFTLTADPGVTFSAAMSGANVLLKYDTSSLGLDGTLKYTIRRWA